jgi:UDP-glucose 4-epimerase
MKILVIGGAGYIGSHIVLECLKQGYTVVVYDNLCTGSTDNIFPETEFIKGDILDFDFLLSVMKKGFDAIIHLAAYKAAGESMIKPEKYSINNISGTLNLLNCAITVGIPHIVFSSSAAVYGEPKYLPLDEKHPTDPSNYYGFTKLSIEEFLKWYSKLKNLHFASLRYFNAAGYDPEGRVKGLERNPANLIPIIMEVAVGIREKLFIYGDDYDTEDGTGVRDYVHVSDLSRAHLSALEYCKKNNENIIVNLGSGKGISVKKILETSRQITKMKIPAEVVGRREGDPAALFASSKTAKELLGWEAKYSDANTLIETTWNVYKNILRYK